MVTRATRSYEYNVICDVCRRKMKASDLRKRWDGFMVCKDDWEPRHPLDFYRPKNDTHVLPFTRPDVEVETTYTPTLGPHPNYDTTGTVTVTGYYTADSLNSKYNFIVQITPSDTSPTSGDTSTNVGTGTCTTPTTPVSAGSFTVMGSRQGLIGTGTIAAATATFTLPAWAWTSEVITIKGQYGS